MTADDAVLLLSSEVRTGEGINSWFETNAPVMQNLVTNSEISNEGEDMAYEAGTYTHGVQGMDQEFSGVYTVVWEQVDGDWKIKLMDITQTENESDTDENETES